MYHRRSSQSDTKSSNHLSNSCSSTHSTQSISFPQSSTTTNRISIYSIREKIISNRTTRINNELLPDAETEVTNRFHQDIPAIQLDSHLTYCFCITLQNLIYLNAIHILLYHAVFWLNPAKSSENRFQFSQNIEKTDYEETVFITISNDHDDIIRSPINVQLINKYLYIALIGVGSIELLTAFLWTLQKKLFLLLHRYSKCRNLLGLVLLGLIITVYLAFMAWLFFHTFITHYLTLTVFFIVVIHFIILTLLDKPNLFHTSSIELFKDSLITSNLTRRQFRPLTSSFSTPSSMTMNSINRLLYRSSSPMQFRKVHSSFSSLIFSSRWLSVTEQKLDTHRCSLLYTQTRQEANDLWLMVVRRMMLDLYRTFASFILFDLIPFAMMDTDVRSVDHQRHNILILIFALNSLLTHSVFLFPVKFQINLHRLASHLGQWRLHSSIRTDTIHEWSSECNSYTRGTVIKLSSHANKYFIAEQSRSNAANPRHISHSILSRLFGYSTYFLIIQFILCMILIFCQFIWIIQGKFWYEIFISTLIIFNSSYTIFKIIRDRLLFDMIDDNKYDEIISTSKENKLQLNK